MTTFGWIDQLSTLARVFLILNVLFLLWRFKSLPDQVKVIGPFILLTLIVEFYADYLSRNMISNLFLLHLYTFFEFLTWSLFYWLLFRRKLFFRKTFPWFVGIVAVLIIANTLYVEPMSGFNSNAKSFVQILLIGSAIFYFFDAFGKIDLTQALPRSLSLINFAILLYYSGSLFIFMFSKLLNNNQVAESQQYGIWAINALLYVIFLILIFFSLWTAAFRKTKS